MSTCNTVHREYHNTVRKSKGKYCFSAALNLASFQGTGINKRNNFKMLGSINTV